MVQWLRAQVWVRISSNPITFSLILEILGREKQAERENVAKLLAHLQVHGEYPRFEVMYQEITQFYYTGESKNKADELKDQPERFLKHVIMRIESEVERSKDIFPAMSWKLIQETTEQSLMKDRAEWLATQGTTSMLSS